MTFYRFHWAGCPEFSAANAFSALWGAERNEDGSKTRCNNCNGKGRLFPYDPDCDTCDGTAWEDAVEGYSCFDDADELICYFAERGVLDDDDGVVIVFEGRRVGTGFDGEALAVPQTVTETMPWSVFAKAVAR